jgi:hypothetical protein
MRKVIKLENVKMERDMSNEPLSTVVVELEGAFEDCVTIRTEVVEEDYILRLHDAIDLDDLAKRLVSFAWDMKDDVRNFIAVELNPQSLDVEINVTPYGYDNCYPELHPTMMSICLDESTFAGYDTKEEAVANFDRIITNYYNEFKEDLYELYNVIIDTTFEDIYDEGYDRKYIRKEI